MLSGLVLGNYPSYGMDNSLPCQEEVNTPGSSLTLTLQRGKKGKKEKERLSVLPFLTGFSTVVSGDTTTIGAIMIASYLSEV